MKEKKPSSRPLRWISCPVEEEFLGENRKEAKIERKRIQSKDRSKYKKTDQEKYIKSVEEDLQAKLSGQSLLEGRVLSILPQGILVDWEGRQYSCILKGLLKKEKTHAKNLIAVGDFVLFEKTGENEGIIAHVKPRITFLSRADNLSRRKEQLIAVNIDQVLITVSVMNPPLKIPIIDRYIIATQKGGMKPIIIVNKIDLLRDENQPEKSEFEQEIFQEAVEAYRAAGVTLISVSASTGEGIEALKEVMKNKASVFSGQSGVGKSSLINTVANLNVRVGEVVEKTGKGAHTTTTTNLIPLECGGWCIDTPGIKSFGIWNLSEEEVQGYFPEIQRIGLECQFTNCTHTHEEHCAVLIALEEGRLSPLRFDSYQALMASIKASHVRR